MKKIAINLTTYRYQRIFYLFIASPDQPYYYRRCIKRRLKKILIVTAIDQLINKF